MQVKEMRGDKPLLRFVATWYRTSGLKLHLQLRAAGWRVTVARDVPLDVGMRFAVPLETMGDWMPGYTANRAVNAVPFVCDAPPGIRTSVELPQIIATLRQGRPSFAP
jgi:2,4-diaminopentanoate dehydrogenase